MGPPPGRGQEVNVASRAGGRWRVAATGGRRPAGRRRAGPGTAWQAGGVPSLPLSGLPELARERFRARVSGDPTGAPPWVRDIARVGTGPGWYEPDGVVWRVHGDLSTLVGGVAALLGQGAHPLALAGVQRHSDYLQDPWKRLAGTARWLVVSTFGSAELAEREAARVRGLHPSSGARSSRDGQDGGHGRPGRTRRPTPSCCAGCTSPSPTPSWPRSSRSGATSPAGSGRAGPTPTSASGGAAPRRSARPTCRRRRTSSPRRCGRTRRCSSRCRTTCARSWPVRPGSARPSSCSTAASPAGRRGCCRRPSRRSPACPGRGRRSVLDAAQLRATRLQLQALQLALGSYSPSEQAARARLGLAPAPAWAA